jgi:hypothetical protein
MIEVRAHSTLADLDPAQMEALNRGSRNASPFASPYWLAQFLRFDREHKQHTPEVLILAAYDGAALTGYIALKATVDGNGRKLSCLITLEVERPQVVALPQDEARVAQAFFRYLVHRQHEWDLLEVSQQDPKSALYAGPDFPLNRHWMRRLPDRQNNVMQVTYADARAYAAAMSQKMRWNVKKQFKSLFAAPGLSALVSNKPVARANLYELFLDIERRSWKLRGSAGVGSREDTYRAVLADPAAPLEFFVAVLMLDGLPIGGSVWGNYGNNAYYFQSVYAESHEALSPGTLMTWIPIQSALTSRRTQFNMLPDFAYYKSRWLADTIDTETLQVFRVGSRYHLKAVLGDFKRKIMKGNETAKVLANPYKEAAGKANTSAPVDRVRVEALTAAARAAGATELDALALKTLSPFS